MTLDQRIEFLMQSIESHDRQIGELTDKLGNLAEKVSRVTDAVEKLVQVTNEDAISIRALARIAEAHDKRLDRIEGQ